MAAHSDVFVLIIYQMISIVRCLLNRRTGTTKVQHIFVAPFEQGKSSSCIALMLSASVFIQAAPELTFDVHPVATKVPNGGGVIPSNSRTGLTISARSSSFSCGGYINIEITSSI